jgi:hypothetical protein
LPAETSTQKAELVALMRALILGKKKRLNVYTNFKYASSNAMESDKVYT